MAITASLAREILGAKLGPWAALCHLGDAMSRGLLSVGVTPLAYGAPSDVDLAAISADSIPQFLDVTEYEALDAAWANAEPVTMRSVAIDMAFDDARKLLERKVSMKLSFIKSRYSYALQPLQAGTVNFETNATADSIPYGGSY